MVFENDFKTEFQQQMLAALSFALEADAEVLISEIRQIRKVINTYTYSFNGEFAVGEDYGTFYGMYSVKDGISTITQMKIHFGEIDTESIVKCSSGQTMLNSITNAYNIYCTRKDAMPRIYPTLVEKLDMIDDIIRNTSVAERIKAITGEIRDMFGTNIELVDSLTPEADDKD